MRFCRIEKNIVPLLPKKVVIKSPKDILAAVPAFDLALVEGAGQHQLWRDVRRLSRLRRASFVFAP